MKADFLTIQRFPFVIPSPRLIGANRLGMNSVSYTKLSQLVSSLFFPLFIQWKFKTVLAWSSCSRLWLIYTYSLIDHTDVQVTYCESGKNVHKYYPKRLSSHWITIYFHAVHFKPYTFGLVQSREKTILRLLAIISERLLIWQMHEFRLNQYSWDLLWLVSPSTSTMHMPYRTSSRVFFH